MKFWRPPNLKVARAKTLSISHPQACSQKTNKHDNYQEDTALSEVTGIFDKPFSGFLPGNWSQFNRRPHDLLWFWGMAEVLVLKENDPQPCLKVTWSERNKPKPTVPNLSCMPCTTPLGKAPLRANQ
eukprot:778769-Amphidinium_carterae.1